MSHEPNRRAIFAAALARALPDLTPYAVALVAERFMRLAKPHGNLQVEACAADLNEHQLAREAAIEAELTALARECGLSIALGGDPRGYTVKVKHAAFGDGNTWAKDGWWGVPQ